MIAENGTSDPFLIYVNNEGRISYKGEELLSSIVYLLFTNTNL